MSIRLAAILIATTFLGSCSQPLEKMKPVVPVALEVIVLPLPDIDDRPKLEETYVDAKASDADFIVDVVIQGPDLQDWFAHSMPIRRTYVPGYQSLPSYNIIGDGWDAAGTFTGADHFSMDLLDISDTEATVGVYVALISPTLGDRTCQGKLRVSLWADVQKKIQGGCKAIVKYRPGVKRSNDRLTLPARGRPTRT